MENMREQVLAVLDKIRPYLQREGGDVELVSIEDGVVTVQLTGACMNCMSMDITFSEGIEAWLMDEVPGIERVQLANTMDYFELGDY